MAAQYQTDFAGQTLGQPSSAFTPYAGATFTTNEIVEAAASISGRAWRVRPLELSVSQRTFLSFDAVAADPDRDHFEAYVRARGTDVPASNGSFALAGRMSGARGTENLYHTYNRSNATPISGLQKRTNGSFGAMLSGSLSALVTGRTLHLKLRCVGDQISHKQWIDADPEPATWSTTTDASHADGEIGLFWVAWTNSAIRAEMEIDYFAVSTGGLAVLMPGESPSTTPVAFTGTVPTLNGTESAAFSESVASYFSGTETPFSYAVHAGTLPAGLSLNTSTGVISGTPSAAGTASGVVIRATDTATGTADTNAFDIVIAASINPPDTAPANLAAVAQSHTQINITWSAVSGATGYDVEIDGGVPVDVGNVLLYQHTGLTAATQYSYRVRAYNLDGDGPWATAVQATTSAAPAPTITLLPHFDTSNFQAETFEVLDAETSTPTIRIKVWPTNWCHWYFGITGDLIGKRPIFEIDISSRNISATYATTWRPSLTYDQKTWAIASSAFTPLTTPTRVVFQPDDPLTADTVYFADHPAYRVQDFDDLAASLVADTSGLVAQSALADANGVYFVSPAENSHKGAAGGHNLYGFVLSSAQPTTDGGPKRRMTVDCGIHSGEVLDGWPLEGIIDFYINGVGAHADRIRANWIIGLYFPITPNGRWAGHYRWNPTRTGDPNRDWEDGNFGLIETAATRDAILADLGGNVPEIGLSLHTAANLSSTTSIYRSTAIPDPAQQNAWLAALDTADAVTWTKIDTNIVNSVTGWHVTRGTPVAVISEFGTRTTATVARYRETGQRFLEATAIADADGVFYTPPAGTITAAESADTASLAGASVTRAAVAAVETADTANLTGWSVTRHAITATEAQDSATLSGRSVTRHPITAAESPDTAIVVGNIPGVTTGQINATESRDTATIVGRAVVRAPITATDSADSSIIVGFVPGVSVGAIHSTEQGDAATATGRVVARGAIAVVESADRAVVRTLTADPALRDSVYVLVPAQTDVFINVPAREDVFVSMEQQ